MIPVAQGFSPASTMPDQPPTLLSVRNLTVVFPGPKGDTRVDLRSRNDLSLNGRFPEIADTAT